METLRATGRTTRLLDDAIKQAEDGKAVYVVTSTMAHSKQLKETMGKDKAENLGIKFETTTSVNFDWGHMRVLGSHPNCVFLVDHSAIEQTFSPMLEMLHRYDS